VLDRPRIQRAAPFDPLPLHVVGNRNAERVQDRRRDVGRGDQPVAPRRVRPKLPTHAGRRHPARQQAQVLAVRGADDVDEVVTTARGKQLVELVKTCTARRQLEEAQRVPRLEG
jgi:hypothetical protein